MIILLLPDIEHSEPAIDWALTHAQLTNQPIAVVAAGSDVPGGAQHVSPRWEGAVLERLAATDVGHTFHRAGVDAAEVTLRLAHELSASLIVASVRRRSATMKLFTGSTAQRVLLEAECPVVAVKRSPGD